MGNIGSYLYNYLKINKKILTEKIIVYLKLNLFLLRTLKKERIKINKKNWLNNYLEATKSKEVDLVVELIGGAEGPAKNLVFSALRNKKHVVILKP